MQILILSFDSDTDGMKSCQGIDDRYRRHSFGSRERLESRQNESTCNNMLQLETRDKHSFHKDSYSRQNGKDIENYKSNYCSPDSFERRDTLKKSNSEDDISEYKSKKRRISSEINSNHTKKKTIDSASRNNHESQYTYLDKNMTTACNNDKNLSDDIENSSQKSFYTSQNMNDSEPTSKTIDTNHPPSIPTIFNHPPPGFSSTVNSRPKTVQELEYERAVNSFIQNTKRGLIKESAFSQSRKYYDNDGNRIYHPDDPRSKYSQRKNCTLSNKGIDAKEDDLKNRSSFSDVEVFEEKKRKEEIDQIGQKERSDRDFAQKLPQSAMLEEIGALSKAINLDELDQR